MPLLLREEAEFHLKLQQLKLQWNKEKAVSIKRTSCRTS